MADASRFPLPQNANDPPTGPRDWREAFSALPPDAPDAPRWAAVAQALAARDAARARRRRIGLALAAGLCALALLPFALRRTPDPATPATADLAQPVATQAATAATAAAGAAPTAAPPVPAPAQPETQADARTTALVAAATDTPAQRPAAARGRASPRARSRAPATSPAATTASQAIAATADGTDAAPDVATGAGEDTLDALYAASAQLEALLALARDPRVDSGPAAALAGGYDADLATIDAQLAQPDLSADAQRRLWRARVDLLQQATGLESQLRVLAASGRRLDGALVRVD